MTKTLKTILKLTLPVLYLLFAHRSIGQSQPLSMKAAIEMALTNNNSLKADSMNLLITDYQNKTLKSDFLPQVNYSSNYAYNLSLGSQMIPGKVAGQPEKDLVPVQFGTRYNWGSGVEVTQTLFQKSTRIKINAAGLNDGIAMSRYKLSKEELVYQVAVTFYSLQANAEMIRTTTKDYQNLVEILNIAKAQYENGTLKKIDYESIEINTANKQSYLHQLQTEYNDQLTHFNYLLGIPADTKTIINDTVSQVSDLVEAGNLFFQREDIRLSDQLIISKETEIKSIRAESKPVVSSFFRFNYQGQFNSLNNSFNNDYWSTNSSFGITTSISLFDGHRRRARVHTAQSQLQQLNFQLELTKQLASTEWLTANETLHKDQVQYQITSKNLALAEKVFTSRKALYTEGVTTLVELLDAEQELSNSRNLHIQAMINVQTSLVNVYKAKGAILTEFLKSI